MEETKVIETPFKKFKVEIKAYLTAEDEFEIQKIFTNAAEVIVGSDRKTAEATITKGRGDVMVDAEKKLMERAVIKINGEARDIVKRLLEMPNHDYSFIKIEVDKIRDYENVKKKS